MQSFPDFCVHGTLFSPKNNLMSLMFLGINLLPVALFQYSNFTNENTKALVTVLGHKTG